MRWGERSLRGSGATGHHGDVRAKPIVILLALEVALQLVWVASPMPAPVAAQGAVPAPPWARSVLVIDDGAVLYREPRAGSPRRGTVALGTRLPLVRRLAGNGCPTGFWVETGPSAFVCEHYVRLSPDAAGGVDQPPHQGDGLLPNTHAFVAFDGTRAYERPSDHDADDYVEAYGEGFGLVLLQRTRHAGLTFFQTRRGLWVEASNLRFARGSTFQGIALDRDDPFDVAFVRRNGARVHARPRGPVLRRLGRRDVVHVAEEVSPRMVRLVDGTFMRRADLRRATVAPRPAEVGPNERWIDVHVDEQVMTAYEGDRPVYVTLISSGRNRPSHDTPRGTFRVWVKLATSDMDDLERTDVERNYSIEAVPWVQYFEGSNGFHAAFWHDDFGQRHSHGCVNLSPTDARWLFSFTEPALPSGWYAILPTEDAPGTVVRVR